MLRELLDLINVKNLDVGSQGHLSLGRHTPTGNGLGLDSSVFTPVRQRSKRP